MAPNTGTSSSGQPLFIPVSHPELRRLGRKTVHIFLRERESYLLRIKDAQATGSSITPISLRSSIDRDLLDSLISFNTFKGIKDFESLTDEILEAWLREKDGTRLESVSLQDLEAALKASVRINVHEPDAELRIYSLFTDYRTLLSNKKWERLIEESPKVAIRHVTALLKPAALKKKIEENICLNIDDVKKNWLVFFEKVRTRAMDCDQYVSIHSTCCGDCRPGKEKGKETPVNGHVPGTLRATRGGNSPSRPLKGMPDKSKRRQHKEAARDAPANKLLFSAMEKGQEKVQHNSGAQELPDCLNPKCEGTHYVKDCNVSSEEEKRKFLTEYHESKRKKGRLSAFARVDTRQSHINEPSQVPPHTAPHRKVIYHGKLADTVEVLVNGDYGSDHAALSEKHLKQLADAGIFVPILPFQKPIYMGLAIDSSNRYAASRKARISTTIQTANGPLRFRNLEYLVFEEDLPEVLLSRPLLMSIGFDLDAHLAKVRKTFHNADFSHVGFSEELSSHGESPPLLPGCLSRLLLADHDNCGTKARRQEGDTEWSRDPRCGGPAMQADELGAYTASGR